MHLGTHSAEYKLVTLICSTNKKRTNKKMLTNVRPSATADFYSEVDRKQAMSSKCLLHKNLSHIKRYSCQHSADITMSV